VRRAEPAPHRTRPARLAALALAVAAPAHAQVAGAISAESDYRLRGFSLSDKGPALSANLSYDLPAGPYVGVAGAVGLVPHNGPELLSRILYGGFALRRPGGGSWDVGVSAQRYESYRAGLSARLKYDEVYAGWNGESLDAHLRYSPNYIRPGVRTLYLDLNGAREIRPDWRVFGHLGVMDTIGGRARGSPMFRYDVRVGVARQVGPFDAHLAFTTRGPRTPGPSGRDRHALTVGASYVF